jgi:hypothetical protein
MADLKRTTAPMFTQDNAAEQANDLVRKVEYDAALALRPTAAEMAAAISAAAAPVTAADTSSVKITLSGQQISADVQAGDGLVIGSNLAVRFGSGNAEVARGDHTHAELHDAATGASTSTALATVTGQQITVDVKLQPGSALYVGSQGLDVQGSSFSASAHTHNHVTLAEDGFMSTAMLAELDAATSKLDTLDFVDTPTVALVIGSNHKANVRYWTGLKENAEGNGLEVDFDDVARADHSHDEYVVGSVANRTFRITDQIYLWDAAADPATPWRALGCYDGQPIFGPPVA